MKLYEINSELKTAIDFMEEWASRNDGDLTEFPLSEELELVEMARDIKLLSIACVIKNYESEAEAIDAEIKKLTQRKKSSQSKADSMRNWLEGNISKGEKLQDARAAITWRSSKSVSVKIEAELLPTQYQRIKIEADKTSIKEALTNGEIIVGCELITNQNMQIK